ncbi:L-methionine transporter [Cryptococcus neoformans c45]|nr:L-methionine transporter [Cryptococcus neoformans var. grubii c45]
MASPYIPLPAAPLPHPEDSRSMELSSSADDDERHGRPRLGRSATINSLGGFEFEHALLPLTLSGDADVDSHKEERHVELWHGVALVVGAQVGSGIFSSPGVVVQEVGSVGASLVVWIISGVLAWTGASSYAELGCAIPLSGGSQAYLAYAFGPITSYLFTWTAVSALKPGSAAMIALIFGEYINRLISHALGDSQVPAWSIKVTAVVAIFLCSILNAISPTVGTNSTVILTVIKIGALVFVAVLGTIVLLRDGPGEGLMPNGLFKGTLANADNYAIAIYSGLWAFDGWDACCYVAGEMRDTNRDLPRALHYSMAIVVVLFLGANLSYFIVLSPSVVASSNTVALDFGKATIGRFGAVVFSTLVAISCFGALNGGLYTTARLIYAASKEHFLPSIFSRLHPQRRTPDNAILLQGGLAIFFVIFGGGFRALLNFFSVASWTFYLLTVLGLLVLRVKEPRLDRPYRAWLVTPIVFCAVSMFLLLMPIFAAPWEAFAAFVFIASGMPVYYLTVRSRTRNAEFDDASNSGRGVHATLSDAWIKFREDIDGFLPQKWQQPYRPQPQYTNDERRGMLGEQVEMSERR